MKITWSIQWEVGDLKDGDRLRQVGFDHKLQLVSLNIVGNVDMVLA